MSIVMNPAPGQVIETSTDVGDPNDTTSDTLHGKLGTDTEMADGSMFDILNGTAGILALPLRLTRATAALPQSAAAAIFTITGGDIELLNVVGEVTTAIETQANATKLTYNPTATGNSSDICATLDITAAAVGIIFGITGTFAGAMHKGAQNFISKTAVGNMANSIIMGPGTIDLDCNASNTGSVQWTIIYRKLESASVIVAA